MIHISLFSGFGGFDFAAKQMGYKNYVSCEINEFANTILEYYHPEAYHHRDITTLNYDTINTELTKKYGSQWRTDDIVVIGGFPCQPFSLAGKRKGTGDERYLWGEMLRTIQEVKPKCVIAENVFGLIDIDGGLVFESVCLDLENEGYEVQPFVLPACGKNAPHRRDRVWIVAYSPGIRFSRQKHGKTKTKRIAENGKNGVVIYSNDIKCEGQHIEQSQQKKFDRSDSGNEFNYWKFFPTQSPIYRRNDGLSKRLCATTLLKTTNKKIRNFESYFIIQSIKGYGNAIVPQIALELFKALEACRSAE